jgi:O-antigen/teichoic acid export membrane protein
MRESSVRVGAFLSYLVIGLSILSGVLITPWVIRRLGRADYGLMTLAGSLAGLLAVDLGLSAATAKFVAKYRAEGDEEEYGIFLRTVFATFLVLDILLLCAFIVLWWFAGPLLGALSPMEVEKLRVLLGVVGVQSVLTFPLTPVNGVLSGNERFVSLKMGDLGLRLLTVGGTVACLLAGGGLTSLVVTSSLAVLAAFAYKLIRSVQLGLLAFGRGWSQVPSQVGVVARFAVWTTVITISQRLSIGLAPSLLAALAGAAPVALFAVAAMLESYVWLLANAVNGLFLAKVTRLVSLGESGKSDLTRLAIRVGRFQMIMLGLLYFGFVFAGRDFLALWLGREFGGVYLVAVLLMGPSLVIYTQEVYRLTIIATDTIRWTAFGSIISACVSFPLAWRLIPLWGALGAGIAIAVANSLGLCIFMNVVYSRILHFEVAAFFCGVHLALLPALTVSCALLWVVGDVLPGVTWPSLMLKVSLMVACYGGVIYLFGLRREEREEARSVVSRRCNAWSAGSWRRLIG